MAYCVIVDDLYHYMDEDARCEAGVFATADEALACCIRILQSDLKAIAASCKTADSLYGQWLSFGEDPFIVTTDGSPPVEWSSRQYVFAHGAEVIASVQGAASPPDGATA
ncbi:hypothetical protein [Geminicoccus harenae]|uniref:hypothetical protein n=1 Tax=Geminicoccus harenae TaxID=2498453 RepID=UPI00168BE615|nr:hypothetical protein [Geminicoccus harenae]